MLKSNLLATLIIALQILSPATLFAQNTYQVEYLADYTKSEEGFSEIRSRFLAAEIYFEEVNTKSHPYKEAAFLEQKSSLAVGYINADATSTTNTESEAQITLLLATYIIPESSIIVQGLYAASDTDFKNGIVGSSDSDTFGIGVGKYLDSNSAIIFEYVKIDEDTILTTPALIENSELTNTGLNYKLVNQLATNTAFNLDASINSLKTTGSGISETNTIIGLSGDYYIDQKTSFGASLKINSGDAAGAEGKTIGIQVTAFITPAF